MEWTKAIVVIILLGAFVYGFLSGFSDGTE